MDITDTAIVLQKDGVKLVNKKLQSHTNTIEKLMLQTKKNMYEISARLLIIRDEKLYVDDNFKDIFDYAEKVLNYKKNMVYKLTATAEKFIETKDGKTFVSVLQHDTKDYTVSQLIELNSIESDTAIKLDENGLISPDMNTKEIREIVKMYKNGDIDEQGNYLNDYEETEETEETEENTNDIDKTFILIGDIVSNISTLLEDERVIKNTLMCEKLQEIKKYINNIEL